MHSIACGFIGDDSPALSSAGVISMLTCMCINIAPLSGQAWRGKHCAPAVVTVFNFMRLWASWRRCRFAGLR